MLNHLPRRASVLVSTLASAIALASGAGAAERIDGFRAQMEKWVETRQILSEERAEWEVERETLRATRDLLRAEKEALEEDIAALVESGTAADGEREALLSTRDGLQHASANSLVQIQAMERELLELVPRLPVPLQQKLQPLLVQIPKQEESSLPLGQRLLNVLGVLAQAEKWNGTATFVGETRALRGDQKVQVRTLYWGLGQAIYVDAQGEHAGIGRPGPGAWEFSDEPELAEDAAQLIDIYEGNVDVIDFVSLPVEIQ